MGASWLPVTYQRAVVTAEQLFLFGTTLKAENVVIIFRSLETGIGF